MTYNKRHKTFPILACLAIILASCLTFSASLFTELSFAEPIVDADGDETSDNVPSSATPNNNNSGSDSNSGSNNNSGGNGSNAQSSGEILFEGRADCQPIILGMTPWDCGVTITTDQDTLKSGIWAIATNVSADITIFASFLALGYVIYGGYQYVFSGEEPAKAAAGKKTLSRAFIGLAISMSSAIIMGTIRAVVAGGSNLTNCINESCIGPDALFLNTINWFIGMAGVASAVFVVYGGITYSTSAGSPDKIKKAKSMITNALIGLAIVALAELITAFVSNLIRQAKEAAFIPTPNIVIVSEHQTNTGPNHQSYQTIHYQITLAKGVNQNA